MGGPLNPVEWARKMQAEAADGNDAYNYFQLADQWEQVIKEEKRKAAKRAPTV